MPLSDDTKQRVRMLAQGKSAPEPGMEKHFLMVLAGKGRPATKEENEWLAYWGTSRHLAPESTKPDSFEAVKEVITQTAKSKRVERPPLPTVPVRGPLRKPNPSTLSRPRAKGITGKPRRTRTKDSEISPPTRDPRDIGYKKRYVDEGLAGSREDNKRMRGKQRGEILNRDKE
jgi:hypothetical protein